MRSCVMSNFKQKEYFPITGLCIIYSILPLQTSVSLHIYLVKIRQAEFAALRRWQLTWVKCYFKKALSANVSMPLIARSAARICCRTPQRRLMPPGPKFGPATFVLSIQSKVSLSVYITALALRFHNNSTSKKQNKPELTKVSVYISILFRK